MKISFLEDGWHDYLYWQSQDKKILKRINQISELLPYRYR
ncbi:type II toxin-antitoxin system YoeB family toxin [Cyanobacterium aponinum]|nr:type II toxin-antitoxin system YoeB family toxin [Cyanobacterium aponinum]PHV61184.1 hypothetical protein CSQ80_17040 [Cyanobacterium aponinum IPPAS B-1201]